MFQSQILVDPITQDCIISVHLQLDWNADFDFSRMKKMMKNHGIIYTNYNWKLIKSKIDLTLEI